MIETSTIYQILNKKNGRFYIGSTVDFELRCKTHLNELRTNKHSNSFLQNDYNACGEEWFEIFVLTTVSRENQFEVEQEYLNKFFDNKIFCYNINPIVLSPPSRKGIVLSDDIKSKMSLAKKGKPKSEETKLRMAKAKKGRKRKPFSDETRRKMSKAQLGNQNGKKKIG